MFCLKIKEDIKTLLKHSTSINATVKLDRSADRTKRLTLDTGF